MQSSPHTATGEKASNLFTTVKDFILEPAFQRALKASRTVHEHAAK